MASKPLPYSQAVNQVLQAAGEPLEFERLADAVLQFPVPDSPNPQRTIRGALRRSLLAARTSDGSYASVLWLLKGAVLRHVLTEGELSEGYLALGPDVAFALYPFLFVPGSQRQARPCYLHFEQGPLISQPLMRLEDDSIGIPPLYPLVDWFESARCRPGDSLIVEATDGEEGIYHIYAEPQSDRDQRGIARSNLKVEQASARALARKRVPCPLPRLMPSLIADGAFQNVCPPMPLQAVLSAASGFEVRSGAVRLLLGAAPAPEEPTETAWSESPEGEAAPGGLFKRLFGRGR